MIGNNKIRIVLRFNNIPILENNKFGIQIFLFTSNHKIESKIPIFLIF